MNKLYEKNKLAFSLILIGIYVVLASVADSISESFGTSKIITAPLLVGMSLFLYSWISRRGLKSEYGLCKIDGKASTYIYFIPLAIIVSVNLWSGVAFNMPLVDTVFYVASMLCVGFLEEIIFRGFLFKALHEFGVTKAFVISSLTFGIGHIVNLLNGAELLPTLMQIAYAVAIGFLFTLIFYKSKSLLPCIIAHSVFNSLSAFGAEPGNAGRIITFTALCGLPALYAVWILKTADKKK